jgi:hypothetical protein
MPLIPLKAFYGGFKIKTQEFEGGLSRETSRTDGRSDDGRGGVRDLDAL